MTAGDATQARQTEGSGRRYTNGGDTWGSHSSLLLLLVIMAAVSVAVSSVLSTGGSVLA